MSGLVGIEYQGYGPIVLLARLLVGLVVLVGCVGSASAGNYVPPPGDGGPQWLTSSMLLYVSGSGASTVNAVGEPDAQVVWGNAPNDAHDHFGFIHAPTAPLLAYGVRRADREWLAVSALDGSNERLLAQGDLTDARKDLVPIAWQSDSSRIFFGSSGGSLTSWDTYRIFSIRPDGSGLIEYPPNVHGIPSPDGSRFAYTSYSSQAMRVVDADGSGDKPIAVGVHPVWSPDGSQLAFWSSSGLAVANIGRATRHFAVNGAVNNGTIAWSPNGIWVYADSSDGLVRIDRERGKRRTIAGIPLSSDTVVSPDGTRIAYAAGGECRDRRGIYVANAEGSDRRRVSNSCRIVGTDGADVLHGDFSHVVVGLGGNDTLYADDTYYYWDGNTLLGGPGNDLLMGGYAQDSLYGGTDDDRLIGGPSVDILVGGPGHDHIGGGGGNDVVGAQDGKRDWITCGTNGPGSGVRDHDIVYADGIDVVAHDCELVHLR